MSEKKHAVLSASSAHRWLACPPSALACAGVKDTASEYAQQGTDAHSLCEYKLLKSLGQKAKDPTENLTYFDEEMADCSDAYAEFVQEQVETAKQKCADPIVLVEQRLDFSEYVPEGFGTGDCVIVGDGTLSVIDFKYGVGIVVEAEKNPQMMCYALGALALFDGIYDIDTVYHMLNYHATFTKGTIEFRLFQFDEPTAERKGGIHAGQLKSYIQLCLALSQMAKDVRTASPKPQQNENPKYAMRTWLLRLGFIGEEFATARDFLTRNLSGDTAFRHGRAAA